MRESRTSGSVRGLGRESLVYSTAAINTNRKLKGCPIRYLRRINNRRFLLYDEHEYPAMLK